ncbi:MAG: F0F1 ATP synthase subunit A [Chthoniobacterales bacterium]|nr:F0F1 ATP synthase subunit A [Chthoniobacterales bacterium]
MQRFPLLLAAGIPLKAESPWEDHLASPLPWGNWITNSIFVSALVVVFVVWFSRSATRQMEVVPGTRQNLFESIVESLYSTIEGIVGRRMVALSFPLLASIFFFILFSNWFSLLPGVGSIGWGERIAFITVPNVQVPLLRPATADLNLTLGIATFFMAFWLIVTIRELGFIGFLEHLFGVKGGFKGLFALLLLPIFFFVGVIEVISIIFRPVSLSLRLFGNIFAGENLLSYMITLGKQLGLPEAISYLMSILVPIPFYFLELLIGFLQAVVFTLLCAVYIQLSTSHDDDSH